MAENLRRAYSRRYIFKSWEEVYKLDDHLHSKDLGFDSDLILVFDSDDHMIYRAEKTPTGWETSKVSYKFFDGGWLEDSDIDPDLAAAYGLKYYFTDKSDIYNQGLFAANVDKGHKFFLFDSEGPRVWTPNLTYGTQRSHFDSDRVYIYPYTRLNTATYGYGWRNWRNEDADPLAFQDYIIKVTGSDFVNQNSQHATTRNIRHADFAGEGSPNLWVKDSDGANVVFNNLETIDDNYATQQSKIAAAVKCNGNYVERAINEDSELIYLSTASLDKSKKYQFHYLTEFGDSEINIESSFTLNSVDSDLVPVLSADSPLIVHNFTNFDNKEEPWRVFDDSDNFGFKAQLGVQTGHLGYAPSLVGNDSQHYRLKQVIIANTPATDPNNRPYDFNIEGKTALGAWEIIEQVRGFDGFTYNNTWDSEYVYYGFRVDFLACQPGFNNAENALEIKQMQFVINTETYNIFRGNRGIVIDQWDTTYTFTLYDSEHVEGLFVGGGGGGGGGIAGGGGAGAGTVEITDLVLPAGTYEIRVGGRGQGGGSYTGIRAKNTQDGTNGGNTYLRDVNNNRNIIFCNGGTGGDDAQETSANNYVYSSSVPGGTATFDNTNYTITATARQGRDGPRGANGTNAAGVDGADGYSLTFHRYTDSRNMSEQFNTFASSGGGGGTGTAADGNGGVNAGDAVAGDIAIDIYGCGGGGSGFGGGSFKPGTRGSTGFAYLVFKY